MFVIIVLALVGIPAIIWGMLIFRQRRNNRKMMQFVMETAAIPVDIIPEIATGLASFLQNVRQVDMSTMSYVEQIHYILENYAGFWHPDMISYIQVPSEFKPENRKLPVIAAGAYLGELVRVCQPYAEWKKDLKNPIGLPHLEVKCMADSVVFYEPFDRMLRAAMFGDTGKVLTELLPFESPELLDEDIRKRRSGNLYSRGEKESFEAFLTQNLGIIRQVFPLVDSVDMYVDMYVIESTEPYPAQRLVTCGMGGRAMYVPEDARKNSPDRIELLLDLPPEWRLDRESWDNERFYCPVRLLKNLVRFPWDTGTWFRLGHAVSWPEPFADNTRLTGVLLTSPAVDSFGRCEIKVSPGKMVHIYQVVPLYPEELDYRVEHGTRKLHELLGENFSYIVDPQRINAVTVQ